MVRSWGGRETSPQFPGLEEPPGLVPKGRRIESVPRILTSTILDLTFLRKVGRKSKRDLFPISGVLLVVHVARGGAELRT